MAEAKMKLTAGALPYEDGSGDEVTASVVRTAEGLRLSIEMTNNIDIEDWMKVRAMVDALVKGAFALSDTQ